MTHDLRIRRMDRADLPSVLAIAANLEQAPHWAEPAYQTVLDPTAIPSRIALVAESGREIQGFLIASLLPPEAELESIAVAAAHQRQGLASRLFAALRTDLRSRQITAVLLEVRASNRAAEGLYRALGFEKTGRRPRYYVDPTEDAILMRYSLENSPESFKPIDSPG